MILTVSTPARPNEIPHRSGTILPSLGALHAIAAVPDSGELAAVDPALTANVPEPDTLALVGAAVAAVAVITLIRRKRRGK